jgi:hypothetical protein
METAIKLSTPELCIAEYDRVAINVWSSNASPASWSAAARHLRELHGRFPTGISALVILPGHAAVAPQAVDSSRESLLAVAKQFFRSARACAFSIEASGFAAAAQRSALTAVNLVLRPSFPVKVFNTLDPAVSWLAPLSAEGEQPQFARELLACAVTARARMVPTQRVQHSQP